MTSDPDDAELITRSLGGDQDAFVEDLTVADAGRALGMPPGSARRVLHQARMALRNAPGMAALLADQYAIKEAN
jgi:hypothetical protein